MANPDRDAFEVWNGEGWIDISRPLSPHTPVWPGDTPFELDQKTIGGLLVTALSTTCHAGTHLDAPLHLGEARESGQGDDVVPELTGLLVRRQTRDHRPEEGDAVGGFEVDDRCTHVAAGARQRIFSFFGDLGIPGVVVERLGFGQRENLP